MGELSRRVAFRFAVVFGALAIFPFPLDRLPYTRGLAVLLTRPIEWGVDALAWLLGLPAPINEPTGSGDTMFAYLRVLLIAIVAITAAIGWASVDRRRTRDPAIAAAARVMLRYWLAFVMMSYGLAKLWPIQFRFPSAAGLDVSVGDKSPMGLLWTFMGYSRPYTVFVALAEIVGSLLLLSRRTATLGALVLAAVLTNIVLLNFAYDVPVKLFSLQLLAAALVLVAIDARRLIAAALGYATREVPPRPRLAANFEHGRQLAKLVLLLAGGARLAVAYGSFDPPPPTVLDGGWDAQSVAIDGVARPPVMTDDDRWRHLAISADGVVIRVMTDRRLALSATVEPATRTIVIAGERWNYRQADADHLELDGVLGGRRYHVALVREPDRLLVTRGFHWIQEQPFNR